jgi:hypothetical protein
MMNSKKTIVIFSIIAAVVLSVWFLPSARGDKAAAGISQTPPLSNGIGHGKKCDECGRQGLAYSFKLTEPNTELFKVPDDRQFVLLRIYTVQTEDSNCTVNWDDTLWQLQAGDNLLLDEIALRPFVRQPLTGPIIVGTIMEDFPDGTVVAGPGQSVIVTKPQNGCALRMTLLGYFSACTNCGPKDTRY